MRTRRTAKTPDQSSHAADVFAFINFRACYHNRKRKARARRLMCPRPRFRYFTFLLNPAPLLLKSLYLALNKLAFERGRAVEEDYAVAVIRLVQHAAHSQFDSVE